jgi:hypothetical protein
MPGFNDLASLSPELAKEWHPTKNSISPDMVTVRSGISVWWKCKICGNEWKSSVSNRTAGNNCSKCQGYNTSFAEQSLFFYISQIFSDTKNRYIEPQTKKEIDIYIKPINFAIEYDGFLYHKNDDKRVADENKIEELSKVNIPVLRIRESSRHLNHINLPQLKVMPYKIIEYHPIGRYKSLDKLIHSVFRVIGDYSKKILRNLTFQVIETVF